MDRGAWRALVHVGHKRVRHDLVMKTQQQSIFLKSTGSLWNGLNIAMT